MRRKWRALERKWRKSQHEIDSQLYTTQVKLVGSAIQTAKANYYQESLNNVDPKTTFQILQYLIVCEKCSIFFTVKMDKIMKNIQDVITSESITTIHNTPHFSPPIVDKRRPTDAAELQRIIMAGPFESSCLDALPTAL